MSKSTQLPLIDSDVAAIKEALGARPTPGPYRVITDEIPHRLGGAHKERRIFTTWDHPQLKGPLGVVNHSFGLGAKDGDPAVHMVAISKVDADWIAACSPDRIERILAALAVIQPGSQLSWRAMLSAPLDQTEVELLIRHADWWAAHKAGDGGKWQVACRGKWIDFNGGGWTWSGLAGVPVGWRPIPTIDPAHEG